MFGINTRVCAEKKDYRIQIETDDPAKYRAVEQFAHTLLNSQPEFHAHWVNPHWLNDASCADCSLCGHTACHYDFHGVQKNYAKCPHCGAIMDEEDE